MATRTRSRVWFALALLGALASCGRQDEASVEQKLSAKERSSAQLVRADACPSDHPGLSVAGLCSDKAEALVLAARTDASDAPDGCNWTVRAAALPDNRALLYRAARCGLRTAELRFVPGRVFGSFILSASPYGDVLDGSDVVARMAPASDAGAIIQIVRASIDDPQEARRCHMRPAGLDGWPSDALVADEDPKPTSDGVRTACGPLGLDEGSQTFWRLSQGQAWFFQFGQELPVVDSRSFTLVGRSRQGDWQRL